MAVVSWMGSQFPSRHALGMLGSQKNPRKAGTHAAAPLLSSWHRYPGGQPRSPIDVGSGQTRTRRARVGPQYPKS